MKFYIAISSIALMLCACNDVPESTTSFHIVEFLITDGKVYSGEQGAVLRTADVGISGDEIVFVGDAVAAGVVGQTRIDASGKVVTAGFIDPHTHSQNDLLSDDKNNNLNYLLQGVTTVFNGNDGDGDTDLDGLKSRLETNGIGTNTALFIGHGALRQDVMQGEDRAPTADELEQMKGLIRSAMKSGALGLSTGLFYAPGSFSETAEVIELAAIVGEFDGVYDTHLRDESNYSLGVVRAVEEALTIGEAAGVPVHISHIKALGVDVWGQSDEIIAMIEAARASGQTVSANQYPWSASGTHMRNALLPKHLLEGKEGAYLERLRGMELSAADFEAVRENMRRRGGPGSLLVVVADDSSIVGKTLEEIAAARNTDPAVAALEIIRHGSTRIASFNMSQEDIESFMMQDWVMTSSDGTDGHPRKYASFPKKFQDYVVDRKLLSLEDFLYRSSALTAETFGLHDRGRIEVGKVADVVVFDPESFAPTADFNQWDSLSTGVHQIFVNGRLTIDDQKYTGTLAGVVLNKSQR